MTVAEPSRNPENYCYRHPDRQSFALCQRCTRTICPECQTPAAVGVICPECIREQRKSRTPAQRRALRRWGRSGALVASDRPVVTNWIVAITGAAFLLNLLLTPLGFGLQPWLAFYAPRLYPQFGSFEPWRLVSVTLVHSGFLHVALNLLSVWIIGRLLEPTIGRWRFLALYLISAVGGSVAVALLSFNTPVVGASGALFGMLGALVVIGRQLGGNVTGVLIILGINLAVGFVFGGISWEAHVGGLIAGLLVGLIFARTRRADQFRAQAWLLAGLTAVLLALLAVPPAILF
ncbi:rhomboid family intramembrane serine protease [Microbacterium album]|uniref:Rhomboid family intramembrane serine protease n=1 Tax=Microbacterium album TaxID=2053191 RepID=A0A917IED6_9MICO|nr:rhomboid family intramembrane serine protease [Microbacterium album]GGH44494.1 rhomboid family intramembrane serine protease [Microbacterium album]